MPNQPTPMQIRCARGMLNWSVLDLAKAAGVSVSTVKRAELEGQPSLSLDMCLTISDALVGAGISFLDDDGEGVGVRIRVP